MRTMESSKQRSGWKNAISKKQNLTFAGVNTHHQNGIAEQRIRELQETTRAMLIHASKQWPGDKQSPNKIFDNSAVDPNPKHWKPFGCPAYILKAELQGTTGIHPKWDARSRADPQQKCGLSIEHTHRVHQSAIPCQVRRILLDHPTRQMECDLVVKYRIHGATKQGVPI